MIYGQMQRGRTCKKLQVRDGVCGRPRRVTSDGPRVNSGPRHSGAQVADHSFTPGLAYTGKSIPAQGRDNTGIAVETMLIRPRRRARLFRR